MSDKQSLQNFAADVSRQLLYYKAMPNYTDLNNANGLPVNSTPVFIDQDALQQGASGDNSMSPVRRFFSLLVTFDLFFSLLLWIICIVSSGLTLHQAFENDVIHYNIHTSMFDLLMIAAVRFTLLILAYTLMRLNHWWVVALSTTLSCTFLVCKVFYFNFSSEWTKAYTFYLITIVVSFVISWIEAWFLDCRVLPVEKQAVQILERLKPDERSSLIHRYLQNNHLAPSETVGTFYSPLGSPYGSDDEDEESQIGSISRHRLTSEEIEYKKKGKETLEIAWQLLQSEGWVLEKSSQSGDTVHSKRSKEVGKIFLLSGDIELNGEVLLEELFYKIEESPKWNPTILYSKIIQKIDSHTDISYNVAAEGAGGIVSPRDFVNLRHWELRDGIFISCGISVVHPDMPPQKKYIRGENGPGAWIIHTNPDDPHKCKFQWLLNTNLKGWIPQYVVDQALSGVMLDCIKYVRIHAEKLKLQ